MTPGTCSRPTAAGGQVHGHSPRPLTDTGPVLWQRSRGGVSGVTGQVLTLDLGDCSGRKSLSYMVFVCVFSISVSYFAIKKSPGPEVGLGRASRSPGT